MTRLIFTATACTGKDLKPGDAFSTHGQDYWDTHRDHKAIGERVYIRTDQETPPDQADVPIFKITWVVVGVDEGVPA